MVYSKTYVGQKQYPNYILKYFVIERSTIFGIGIDEVKDDQVLSEYEYFTENKEEAYQLIQSLKDNQVTRTHFVEILEDYMCSIL